MLIRIYCSECGFLNVDMEGALPVARNECMFCLKGLSPEGRLENLNITIEYFQHFAVRKGASSKAIKTDIGILEKNGCTIRGVIQRIKKKECEIPFQDDHITGLLKQVLKKDLTPEKIGLEKDLYKTRRGLVHLRQELKRELKYAEDSSSTYMFKLLKERRDCTLLIR